MVTNVDQDSKIIQAFKVFQAELDQKHDKHERIVKLSRDVTIESKRVIFLLQRLSGLEQDSAVLDEAQEKLDLIVKNKFYLIAKELLNEDPFQFLRAYSPGLQEYIEALSLHHYLKHRKLVELAYIEKQLSFSNSEDDNDLPADKTKTDNSDIINVNIPPIEYLLGVADLTGEVMRLAVNSVGAGNLQTPFEVCKFLRTMLSGFSAAGNVSRDFNRKVYTLRQSLAKVENVCYTLQIRGSEIPKTMLKDMLTIGTSEVQMYSDETAGVDY